MATRPCHPTLHHSTGFTLVELITAVAIVAITLSFAVPAARNMVLNQRLKSAAADLHFSLIFARSEAIKRHANVTVTAAAGGWENGWTVTDADGNTLQSQDAYEGVADNDATVVAAARANQTAPAAITYRGSGRLSTTANEVQFLPRDASIGNLSMRCVSVTLSGHPRTDVDDDRNSGDGCG